MPYGIHPDADIMIDNENDNTNDDEVMVPNIENGIYLLLNRL